MAHPGVSNGDNAQRDISLQSRRIDGGRDMADIFGTDLKRPVFGVGPLQRRRINLQAN